MLGKLIKHELRSTWRIPALMIGVLMVISLVTGGTLALLLWSMENGRGWIGLPFSLVALVLLYYAALIAANFGVVLYQAVHFYKTMFTDEGYLTHTLPVTSHQLLLSKAAVICIWNLTCIIGVFVSVFLLGGSFMVAFAEEFAEIKDEIMYVLRMGMMENWGGLIVSLGAMTIVSVFYSAAIIIGSISIGQMLRKHRILGAIGAYFGISSVVGLLSMIISTVIMFTSLMVADDVMRVFSIYTPTYLVMALIEGLASVGLYFLSEYLVRRHLELE